MISEAKTGVLGALLMRFGLPPTVALPLAEQFASTHNFSNWEDLEQQIVAGEIELVDNQLEVCNESLPSEPPQQFTGMYRGRTLRPDESAGDTAELPTQFPRMYRGRTIASDSTE
jgi:hypothetical protein